jgi:hypothetical protein
VSAVARDLAGAGCLSPRRPASAGPWPCSARP